MESSIVAIFIQKTAIIVQFLHELEQILYKNWMIFFHRDSIVDSTYFEIDLRGLALVAGLIVTPIIDTTTIQTNIKSQQNVANKINSAIKNILECQQMVKITTDESLKVTLKTKIIKEQNTLSKQHILLKEGVVEQYNTLEKLSATMKDPELWDKIHNTPVKVAKIFVKVFADESIIISQDDKTKIGLGIPAVGCIFKIIQSVNESVTVKYHNFPTGPEYFIETSSATHIINLESIVKNENFSNILKKEDKVRLIWVFFVDGEPDENLKHIKNIIQYAHFFCSFDLDYLTVYTHASEEFRLHLNSHENVIDEKLAK
ncbi:hypothetical protein C1646_773790 [Rhizophagus diaphanus]|nr:hypothetical protein C1646_773790 [Rhizophagus diaphanus] [Rhizophagus sp. MUCL 43196]